MRIAAIIILVFTLTLEAISIFSGNGDLDIWAYILGYAGVGASLMMYARKALDGPYRAGTTLIGIGYLFRALGEWGWVSGLFNPDAGYVFGYNLPYYLSSVAYAVGAYQIYQGVARTLNLSQRWLGGALLAAIITVGLMILPGFSNLEFTGEFWIETLNSIISGFAAFAIVAVGFLTVGGTLTRWTLPMAAAFVSFLIGNSIYILKTSLNDYSYGSLPDFFWMAEMVIMLLMVAFSKSSLEEEEEF